MPIHVPVWVRVWRRHPAGNQRNQQRGFYKVTMKHTKPKAVGMSVKLQPNTYKAVQEIKAELEESMGISLSITQALAIIVLKYRESA